jgi:hypothetical protein
MHGSTNETLLPLPVSPSSSILPPKASMVYRTSASPRPVPRADVEKKGWNIRVFISVGMPGPLSATSHRIPSVDASRSIDTLTLTSLSDPWIAEFWRSSVNMSTIACSSPATITGFRGTNPLTSTDTCILGYMPATLYCGSGIRRILPARCVPFCYSPTRIRLPNKNCERCSSCSLTPAQCIDDRL